MEKIICSICGLEIKENNFNVNNEAMLNNNSIDTVRTCPFCGAPSSYFQSEELVSHKYLLDEQALTIIDHAMKLEVFNSDFYLKASLLAEKDNIKTMFKALSNIEKMHAVVHKNLGSFKELPKLQEIDYTKYKTDEELLAAAKAREEHAVKYYDKYISEISDDKVKEIFKALAQVEKEHIILTTR